MLNEQFQSVFTDNYMQNLPSCKKLFPDMTEINYDIDVVIKQLQKINPNKANCPDKVLARFLKETTMECGAMFHHLFLSVIPAWHTTISLDSCSAYKNASNLQQCKMHQLQACVHTAIPCKIMKHCIVSNIWSH